MSESGSTAGYRLPSSTPDQSEGSAVNIMAPGGLPLPIAHGLVPNMNPPGDAQEQRESAVPTVSFSMPGV